MKTTLPNGIQSEEDAKTFLLELGKNDEIYHPEDDAHDIIWGTAQVSEEECDKLNDLMQEIYKLGSFDPCGFIIDEIYTDEEKA